MPENSKNLKNMKQVNIVQFSHLAFFRSFFTSFNLLVWGEPIMGDAIPDNPDDPDDSEEVEDFEERGGNLTSIEFWKMI